MTYTELREKIAAIQNTKIVDFARYSSIELWREEKLMQLIQEEKRQVAGEIIADVEDWQYISSTELKRLREKYGLTGEVKELR